MSGLIWLPRQRAEPDEILWKDPRTIIRCLTYGTLLALGLYVVWLLVTMGNIPRPQFIDIAQKGGNIDVLVQALSGVLNSRSTDLLLVVFSNFAVASSFLGVTLGLFDYGGSVWL